MTYESKRQRWKQVQCKSWEDPDYSFLISELDLAWKALEFYADIDNWNGWDMELGRIARKALEE